MFPLHADSVAVSLDVEMHAMVRASCLIILHSVTIRIVVPQSVPRIHPVAHWLGTDIVSALLCSVAQLDAEMSNLDPALFPTSQADVLTHAAA